MKLWAQSPDAFANLSILDEAVPPRSESRLARWAALLGGTALFASLAGFIGIPFLFHVCERQFSWTKSSPATYGAAVEKQDPSGRTGEEALIDDAVESSAYRLAEGKGKW